MSIKTFGASLATASLVMFPLAACGSAAPTPVVTVTATPSTTMHPALQRVEDDADRRWSESHPGQDVRVHRAAERAAAQQSKSSGLPWWAWALIVPAGLAVLLVLGIKLMEANDERRVARAWRKVDELDARHRARFGDDDDVEDYPDDDDELPEDDMEFLHRVTEPAPAQPAPPASGSLLSSLRQQGDGAQ
ncbi:hypothetical protein [Mycobacteroides abscessus]|uniref:hypothetical protein n=1 Tax=Mycobacteroides abscessus TaxID=36809 RepID=UPI000C25F867|nr:hypothetical protein [Mycobacteroides abscessus]MBN7311789.1 hypothetical protein [Mycobacteroides abscessus subsp. abscessus]